MRLRDIGEKRLISAYIQPLLNPLRLRESVGDDCALIPIWEDTCVCISTDRVPADLIAFKLGLMTYRELGRYLATLNISDIAACGGEPKGLLLNLGLSPEFVLEDLLDILRGAQEAAMEYGASILGGDLSDSTEMNLVGTAVGVVDRGKALYRSGAQPGDRVFCSSTVGLTPTAFQHYLGLQQGNALKLSPLEEDALANCFRKPVARVSLGRALALSNLCSSAMDVTDGLSQTISEIAASSGVGILLDAHAIPIDPISHRVAAHYEIDPIDLVIGPGADFQLVGTLTRQAEDPAQVPAIYTIGEVIDGKGVYLRQMDGTVVEIHPTGWNYYARSCDA